MGFCFQPQYSSNDHFHRHIKRVEVENPNIRQKAVKQRRLQLSHKDYKFLQSIGLRIRN